MTTKNSSLHIQEFMDYFSGSQYNYGEAIYTDNYTAGKREAKCRTITEKLLTIEEYKQHLKGEKGLGVIPINQDNKCKFGVIDVDVYGIDYNMYIDAIERKGFPLLPFKSKSGGLHLYLFLKEFEPASKVVKVLKEMSFLLSIESLVKKEKNETVEIYPKQTKLAADQAGNWINLPYFDSDAGTQKLVNKGKELSLSDALVLIKKKRTTVENISSFLNELEYNDAPPCLQLINILNCTGANSGRNNYLFSFGVYLKKKDESFFEQNLLEVNNTMQAPLEQKEVTETIIKSLSRKDYIYKCSTSPCIDFCNKKVCKTREFGIGKNEGYFSTIECGQLTQYKTETPYYEWEVKSQGQTEPKIIRFKSEDEIIKQDVFLKLCMRELLELPSKLKQAEWFKHVNQHLKEAKVIIVEREDDTSSSIILHGMIVEFLTGRFMADTKDQIFNKRVYYNKDTEEYWFRIKDLTGYLFTQKQLRDIHPHELHGVLREMGVIMGKQIWTESRRQVRVSIIPRRNLDLPDTEDSLKIDFSKYSDQQY